MDDELLEKTEELSHAASLEGSELGEWWSALTSLCDSAPDHASKPFMAAIKKEIVREHKRLGTEFRIKNVTETRTVTYQKLLHESEDGFDD